MDGYPSPGQPWHHYVGVGQPSLLGAVVLLLSMFALLVILSAARWVALWCVAWTGAWRCRPKSARAPGSLTESRHDAQPVLASDREREETTRIVSQAIGDGRLSVEEGGQRIDSVLRSRHRHELTSLVADLPPAVSASTPVISAALRFALLAVAANGSRRRSRSGRRRAVGAVAARRSRPERVGVAPWSVKAFEAGATTFVGTDSGFRGNGLTRH